MILKNIMFIMWIVFWSMVSFAILKDLTTNTFLEDLIPFRMLMGFICGYFIGWSAFKIFK